MATLDIEIAAELLKAAKRLAVRHYGDAEDTSIIRVIEVALVMRLLWLDLVEAGGREVEEPVVNWEFGNKDAKHQAQAALRDWLFRRR
ncbi:MAG: hypothetical protein ACE5JL_00110 [Dehalococcoidia bacterium]